MRTKLLGLVLALAGCAAPAPAPKAPPRLIVAAEIAEPTLAAIDLWVRATDGEYSPEVIVSDECDDSVTWCFLAHSEITDCGDPPLPYGCTDDATQLTELATATTPRAWWISTLTHEIGHQLKVPHPEQRTDSVMDPDRSDAVREKPCVDVATLEQAGFSGPGACIEP